MKKNRFDLITFGEIMLRLSSSHNERLSQGDTFKKHTGGSELNIASGVSLLGLRTGTISKIPDNQLGKYVKNKIRFCGVSDDFLIYDTSPEARLGIYYYESASHPRKPIVIYDRKGSSINKISIDEIPTEIYDSTNYFHFSGITLGISENSKQVAIEMCKRFKAKNTKISFDVNFRANLWSEEEARKTIEEILPLVDVLFISEETSRKMFKKTGDLENIMKSYCNDYNISIVATTSRKINSPKNHDFGSVIYSKEHDEFFTEEPYKNIEVVDRIGSGDAYVAGVLYGLMKNNNFQEALEFGNAMGAVKNTIEGDLPYSDLDEINKIILSHKSNEQSEMDR